MPSPKRAEEGLPNSNTETETDHDEAFYNGNYGMLSPGNLTVTSSLHPFWHTKKGKAVIGLVVLTVIGAIVGGAIGGVKAHARQTVVSTSSPPSTTTTTSLSSCASACSPTVVGAIFSTTTDHSDVVV